MTIRLKLENNMNKNNNETFQPYHVWELPVRIFHWINVLTILGLAFLGLIILYSRDFGISGDGKLLLKTIHTYCGYVFALNLLLRIVWFFFANKYSDWKSLLPFGKNHRKSLKLYVKGSNTGNPPHYLGHNPLGRIMIATLFLLLTAQGITGLVLAGTDLYMPPFGNSIAQWVAETDESGAAKSVVAGFKENINPENYQAMRDARKPFVITHKYVFYVLLIGIFFHVFGVIVAEIREKSGMISAMFTGKKVFRNKPNDYESDKQ